MSLPDYLQPEAFKPDDDCTVFPLYHHCNQCKWCKSQEQFYQDFRNESGFEYICKECKKFNRNKCK